MSGTLSPPFNVPLGESTVAFLWYPSRLVFFIGYIDLENSISINIRSNYNIYNIICYLIIIFPRHKGNIFPICIDYHYIMIILGLFYFLWQYLDHILWQYLDHINKSLFKYLNFRLINRLSSKSIKIYLTKIYRDASLRNNYKSNFYKSLQIQNSQ